MCNIWKTDYKEITFSQWEKVMKDPIFSSIENLSISGGEPTLHPKFEKLINIFFASMPKLNHISMPSNGFQPQSYQKIKSLIKLADKNNIDASIVISLDGIGKIHEEIRRIPNAFEKTTNTLFKLKKLQKNYDFNLSTACVISNTNIQQIPEYIEWCKKNSIKFSFQLVGFHKSYVNNLEKEKKLNFSDKDQTNLFNILEILSNKKSLKNPVAYYWKDMYNLYKYNSKRTTPCPSLIDTFVIDCIGDVYYCLSEDKIGNFLKDRTVSEIYYDPQNLNYRNNLSKTKCLKCNSRCHVSEGLRRDFKKVVWYFLTGKTWPKFLSKEKV
jgi:MoaA/NifB/PqqE/SkfB family radical SAM enzyme